MPEITITGYSDDLIEIDGFINEEFQCYADNETSYLGISDGTLLSARYDSDGIWRFAKLIQGSAEFEKIEGDVVKDTDDVITLRGTEQQLQWVLLGSDKAAHKS